MDYEPNNNQLGVAIAAALKFRSQKKQCWLVPSGMGKSRIIASIVTIFQSFPRSELKAVYVAFSSDILLETD